MKKKTKICFVIMGFGKKSDPDLGKTYDLDKTYKNIIRPAVTASGYECVRADEVIDSGLIDKSMYALLMQADLVVADITTFNPNAIYELGIRHASDLTRPLFSKKKMARSRSTSTIVVCVCTHIWVRTLGSMKRTMQATPDHLDQRGD